MSETMSYSQIAQSAGMSTSTLYRMRTGVGSVSTGSISAIKNSYGRAAYTNLKESGYNNATAHRIAKRNPTAVSSRVTSMDKKIRILTSAQTYKTIDMLAKQVSQSQINSYYNELEKIIKEGMRNSQKDQDNDEPY